MLIVTYVWILTSNRSTVAYRSGFTAVGTLSYRSYEPTISAHRLVPIILGANSLDRSAVTHCLNGGCL